MSKVYKRNDSNQEVLDMYLETIGDHPGMTESKLKMFYLGSIARSLAQIADELNRMNLRGEKDGNDD